MEGLLLSGVKDDIELGAVAIFYGSCAGMSEGAERAIISGYADPRERGTAFGWYHLMVGIAAIPASPLFGSIWQFLSAKAAFLFAGGLAVCAAILLRRGLGQRENINGTMVELLPYQACFQ